MRQHAQKPQQPQTNKRIPIPKTPAIKHNIQISNRIPAKSFKLSLQPAPSNGPKPQKTVQIITEEIPNTPRIWKWLHKSRIFTIN